MKIIIHTFTSSPALSLSAPAWKKVCAIPFLPALPVLPMRCTIEKENTCIFDWEVENSPTNPF